MGASILRAGFICKEKPFCSKKGFPLVTISQRRKTHSIVIAHQVITRANEDAENIAVSAHDGDGHGYGI